MRNSILTAALLLLTGLLLGPIDSQQQAAAGSTVGGAGKGANPTLAALSEATAELATQVLRATVHFEATRVEGGPDGGRTSGTGSGFVLDAARGILVTNNHVVGSADAVVRVRLNDGRKFEATVVGTDPATDLAVVRIPEGEALYQLNWGNSDILRPGHWVMAVGNPLGEIGTTSTGVISGLNRDPQLPNIKYEDFLQFDAYIDRGSSGGPLVNMAGEVIGVNTAISGQVWQGAGYAVPSFMASSIVEQLTAGNKVRRGYLGLDPSNVDASYADQVGLSRPYGARVRRVTRESPASKAGLQRGDIILAIDGQEIGQYKELVARITSVMPGTTVKLKVWRDGSPMTIRVKVGERPAESQ
ncbi:MAG: trypsin-like peptidase domain-containing protein [Planctomycetes bacterium]|nr:trypsin-like peptidase domain-containing protein [Planctomycetota bacterium]